MRDTLNNGDRAPRFVPPTTEAFYSEKDVAAHSRPSDCWIIVRGVVYDVTSFLESHPGGPLLILSVAGGDATQAFAAPGHSTRAVEQLLSMRVGVLAGGPADRRGCSPGGPCLRTITGGIIRLGALVAIPCATCGAALPEGSERCGICQQTSIPRLREQLQLAGRVLESGEQVEAVVEAVPAPAHPPNTAPEHPPDTAPAHPPDTAPEHPPPAPPPPPPPPRTPAPPAASPGLPAPPMGVAWRPSGQGDWQVMDCPICGPVCGGSVHRPDSAEVLAAAMKKGDAAARRGEWSQALAHYYDAVGAITKRTGTATVAAVHTAASISQRKLRSMHSALRHANLATAAADADAADAAVDANADADAAVSAGGRGGDAIGARAHAARGAALEALGLMSDAHAAFVRAARLDMSDPRPAAAAARLLPLRFLLERNAAGAHGGMLGPLTPLERNAGGAHGADADAAQHDDAQHDDAQHDAAQHDADAASDQSNVVLSAQLSPSQLAFVEQLERAVAAHGLAATLRPLPSLAQLLGDERRAGGRARRVRRQSRVLSLLAVDAAAEAARHLHGGHNADACMRQWVHAKADELGLDLVGELVRAALGDGGEDVGSDDGDGDDEGSEHDDGGESESEGEEEAEGPSASAEVQLPGAFGRVLVQLELAPRRQRLTLSLLSLNAADFCEPRLRYTFAVGLISVYLLQAEITACGDHDLPYLEFAEWHSAERGAFLPADGLPPAASVERRAKAFVDFLTSGEGGRAPLAPARSRGTGTTVEGS